MRKQDAELLAIQLTKLTLENCPEVIFDGRDNVDNAVRLAEFIATLAEKVEGLEDQNGKSMLDAL